MKRSLFRVGAALATLALAGIAPFAFEIWRTCSS